MLACARLFPGQADIDCTCSSELQNMRSVPTCTHTEAIFVCLRQLTGCSGSFRNYLPISGGAYGITLETLASHLVIRLTDWLIWKESVLCRLPPCWNAVHPLSHPSQVRDCNPEYCRAVRRRVRIGVCCRVAPSSSKRPRMGARSTAAAMMKLPAALCRISAGCWPMACAAAAAPATASVAANAISHAVFASANTRKTVAASAAPRATRPAAR